MLLTITINILYILLTFIFNPTHARRTNSFANRSQPTGMGINCRGSSQCSFTTVNSPDILREFDSTLYTAHGTSPSSNPHLPGSLPLPHSRTRPSSRPSVPTQPLYLPLPDLELFFKGEHIICARNLHWLVGSICVFLQGDHVPASGVPGFIIKRLVHHLVFHGCKFCGSIPVSEDNNPYRLGVLTSNYVTDQGCQGVCAQERGRVFLKEMDRKGWELARYGGWRGAVMGGKDGG
ncbi:MAG: hypothetical protein Q9176_002456 [Flavoplaca citrina]